MKRNYCCTVKAMNLNYDYDNQQTLKVEKFFQQFNVAYMHIILRKCKLNISSFYEVIYE